MKKIFTFFTLFILIFIGFLHYPIMVFSMENLVFSGEDKTKVNLKILCKIDCCINDKKYQEIIKKSCFPKKEQIKKISKKINKNLNLTFVNKSKYSLGILKREKNKVGKLLLINNNSNNNYGYYTLIEIVKSNT